MSSTVDNHIVTRPESNLGRVIGSIMLPHRANSAKRIKRSFRQIRTENIFRRTIFLVALASIVLVLGIFVTLAYESTLSIKASGLGYLWGKTWDPVRDIFGAYPFIIGTLLTSFL